MTALGGRARTAPACPTETYTTAVGDLGDQRFRVCVRVRPAGAVEARERRVVVAPDEHCVFFDPLRDPRDRFNHSGSVRRNPRVLEKRAK